MNKSVESIRAHVVSMSSAAESSLPSIISAMSDDEVILYAFTSMMLERNAGRSGRDSITNTINIFTNKKYYFAGADGQSSIFFPKKKSGSVSLKDVHAINAGTMTIHGEYVGFETRNDDYKIWLGAGGNSELVRRWLDDAIEQSQTSRSGDSKVSAALSSAEELKKFKELLDMGVITKEEFDSKKKQLLGL